MFRWPRHEGLHRARAEALDKPADASRRETSIQTKNSQDELESESPSEALRVDATRRLLPNALVKSFVLKDSRFGSFADSFLGLSNLNQLETLVSASISFGLSSSPQDQERQS